MPHRRRSQKPEALACSLLTDHYLGNGRENAKPGATPSEILAVYRITAEKLGRKAGPAFLSEKNDPFFWGAIFKLLFLNEPMKPQEEKEDQGKILAAFIKVLHPLSKYYL